MSQINFYQQVDKKAIFLLFGCYCINPKYVLDEKYSTNVNDYPENFHKMIWGAIVNIAKKGNVNKITPIDIENEISQFDSAMSLWKNNDGWNYVESAIEMSSDKLLNIGKYYDDVRKYSILRNASEYLRLDISFLYDEKDDDKMLKFSQMTSMDVLTEINNKCMDFKSMWKNTFTDNYSFKVGDGIQERLEEHKNQKNVYGYPFQSAYLTTVYRGMRRKKYILRSSISGGGKSRSSLADGCNIVSDRIYDWNKRQWISTGESQPVLFISTELEKKEILEADGSFGKLVPNMSYYVFKNRGGKWKSIIIWTKLNMGTMREVDCFVTDYNYELIPDIEKTIIDFQIEDVGDVGIIESDVEVSGSDLATELSKKF